MNVAAAPAAVAAPPSPAAREYGLDWLRVFAFGVLIFYHSGMGFVAWGWHVKNAELSPALEWVMLACNRWRLPLLFLISGAGVYFSLRRRSAAEFAGERIRRLLLPLVVGIFLVVPPQIYFERRQQGATFSFAEFYPSVFDFVPYPAGSFSWHHLWFVAYILVFSLVGLPLFRAIKSDRGQRVVNAMVAAFERFPPLLYLINVPNMIVGRTLGPHWPTTHNLVADWANLTGTFLTFLWGFTIASNRGFLDLLTRRRREFLILGLTFATLFFTIRATGFTRPWPWLLREITHEIIMTGYAMTWICGLIGYARAYVTRPGRWLPYATEAVYPFYIFHQTITVTAVYYLAAKPLGVLPKLLLVMLATFGGSWLLFEFVRRVRWLRPLFGLKPVQRLTSDP